MVFLQFVATCSSAIKGIVISFLGNGTCCWSWGNGCTIMVVPGQQTLQLFQKVGYMGEHKF